MFPALDGLFVDWFLTNGGYIPFTHDSFAFDLAFELTKLSSGTFVADIVDRQNLKIKCLSQPTLKECSQINNQKFYSYSAHDITLVSLFRGFGFNTFAFEKRTIPSVGASVVFELWAEDSNATQNVTQNYYVKILHYQNSTVETPTDMGHLLEYCTEKGCPLSHLTNRANSLRPMPDLKTFCNSYALS